jgi:ribosomal protein S27AE
VGSRVDDESRPDADDERPPICPACGVTMGITLDEGGATRYACLECGFSDETDVLSDAARPLNDSES